MANSHLNLKLLNLAEPVAVAGGVEKMTLEGGIQKIGHTKNGTLRVQGCMVQAQCKLCVEKC